MDRIFRVFAGLITVFFLASCETAGVSPEARIVVVEDTAMAADGDISPMVVEPAPAMVSEEPASRFGPPPSPGRPRSRVLTAGDIDDGLNLAAFNRFVARTKSEIRLPAANFSRPMLAQLTGPDGKPAPGLRVTLSRPGAAEPFYDGYAGVDGMITVFPALNGAGGIRSAVLKVFPDGQGQVYSQTLRSGTRQVIALPFAGGWNPDFLDLVFVVDTTGSMGDELAWLTKELSSIVRAAKRKAPGVNIRYGLILYRDQGDQYVVKNLGFTNSSSQMRAWLRAQNADGGGDYPEAAADAMAAAEALNWRRGRGERLLFHIADAPPHDADARAYLNAARGLARKGVQVFGLGASGVATEAEYLMRQAAAGSNGRYLFLTDDSGVGYGHAEPTISCYQVTKLNSLMVRVLASELSGRRVEPSPSSVIRSVGSYQNGVCRN